MQHIHVHVHIMQEVLYKCSFNCRSNLQNDVHDTDSCTMRVASLLCDAGQVVCTSLVNYVIHELRVLSSHSQSLPHRAKSILHTDTNNISIYYSNLSTSGMFSQTQSSI